MSKMTPPPASKLALRALSTTPVLPRPSHLLRDGILTRQSKKDDANKEDSGARPLTTGPPSPRPTPAMRLRNVPMMQGFATTAAPRPAQVRPTTTTVDAALLPLLAERAYDPWVHVRVPLLPTTRAKDVAGRAAEVPDAPLAPAEIVVVSAAGPGDVFSVAALTEVEGVGVDGVELKFAHQLDTSQAGAVRPEQGKIGNIWTGLMDQVFGPEKPTPVA